MPLSSPWRWPASPVRCVLPSLPLLSRSVLPACACILLFSPYEDASHGTSHYDFTYMTPAHCVRALLSPGDRALHRNKVISEPPFMVGWAASRRCLYVSAAEH